MRFLQKPHIEAFDKIKANESTKYFSKVIKSLRKLASFAKNA